jgi:hypothetical protein
MNEKQISQICLVIIIVGIILFVITYENEFCEKTISELITNEGNKGIIFGRVQRVIKNDGMALFVITDGNEATVYYPKFLKITKNDFLVVYATSQTYNGKIELVAHRIEKR